MSKRVTYLGDGVPPRDGTCARCGAVLRVGAEAFFNGALQAFYCSLECAALNSKRTNIPHRESHGSTGPRQSTGCRTSLSRARRVSVFAAMRAAPRPDAPPAMTRGLGPWGSSSNGARRSGALVARTPFALSRRMNCRATSRRGLAARITSTRGGPASSNTHRRDSARSAAPPHSIRTGERLRNSPPSWFGGSSLPVLPGAFTPLGDPTCN